jgi:hypothetical protein
MSDVIATVEAISSSWETKRKSGTYGITKHYFHKISGGIYAHKTMLELLPAGSEYVSLFVGVLKSVVGASANHEKIVAGIAKSISEITDVADGCVRWCQLYNTEKVQMLIAKLYAHIFLFLKDAMFWYRKRSWKRALDSFREDFYEHFADSVSNIRYIGNQVKQQAELGRSADVRVTREAVEQMQDDSSDIRLFASGQARQTAELAAKWDAFERRAAMEDERRRVLVLESQQKLELLASRIGTTMFDLLETRATEWKEILEAKLKSQALTDSKMLLAAAPANSGEIDYLEQAPAGREAYLSASRDLELYFDREQIRGPSSSSSAVHVVSEVSYRLQDFVVEARDRCLAIAGSTLLDREGVSTMTKVASSFVDHTDDIGFPVISWFCSQPAVDLDHNATSSEMGAMISLIYTLVRQLIELLPLKPPKPLAVDIDGLRTLDGSPTSIDTALFLLRDLVRNVDFPLFIVVDGLQWLDDVSTSAHLDGLVAALVDPRAETDDEGAPLSVRVLFTTTGRSHALLRTLDTRFYLLAEEGGRNRRRTGGIPIIF